MTGSPLLRLLLVLTGLALIAIPAWNLTGREAPPPPVVDVENPDRAVEILLTFTSPIPPSMITVEADGLAIVKSRPELPVTSLKRPVRLSRKGADLVIRAAWAGSMKNALRVQATLDGNALADTTLWGDPDVEDVITLPARPLP